MSGDDPSKVTRSDKPERESSGKLAREPNFGARYKVLGVLGKGGMGEVFRAFDNELHGEVALKVVRDDNEASLARFRREIALSRKVTNANVLRVYDLAEHDGLRFLAMEYVDGEDLAALLRRDGRLPLERALALFRQVCVGLAAAHAQGVVHRDLKPQNVLVDKEDHVRVADFGIARSIGESGMTATGAVIGSPAYMSPEQVKGEAVDERSDIYSLGVMLYQLVAGATPFQAPTPHSVMEMRLHQKPKPLREVEPATPSYIDAIAARCLALAPAARYPTVSALLADFDRGEVAPAKRALWPYAAIGGVIAAAAIAIAVWPSGGAHERSQHDQAPRVGSAAPVEYQRPAPGHPARMLVLPTDNQAGDPVLGAIENVFASAFRRSRLLEASNGNRLTALAAQFGPSTPVDDTLGRKIADSERRAVYVWHQTVTKEGAGFRISVVAKDGVTGQQLLADSQVATFAEVVPACGRLAAKFRATLGEQIDNPELTGLSSSLDAVYEFSIADQLAQAGNDLGSLPHFQQALKTDPEFPEAHYRFAIASWNLGRQVESGVEFKAAIAHRDEMSERDRIKVLADYYALVTGESDRAIAEFHEMLDKWPNEIGAETNLAEAYRARHDFAKALEAGQRAVDHHPHDAIVRSNLATYELNAGDFAGTVKAVRGMLQEFARPGAVVYEYAAIAEWLLGDHSAADADYEKFVQADPSSGAAASADRAIAEGRLRDAREILDKALERDRSQALDDAIELKEAMLAEIAERTGDHAAALAAAALVAKEPTQLFLAGLVELSAGNDKHALATAAKLRDTVGLESRAEAKVLEAEALRRHHKLDDAIAGFKAAAQVSDTWYAHFLLALALLDAKRFADAKAELELCWTRRGDAALAYDDVPGLRTVPPVQYYLGVALDGLGKADDAAKAYEAFLAMQAKDSEDPLARLAHKRLGK